MAKTEDFELAKQHLNNYLENIQKHLNQCQIQLTKHASSYPINALPFDQAELCLREFVYRERKYLSTKNNEQLSSFRDEIGEKHLFQIVSTSLSQMDLQVDAADRDLKQS